MTAEPTARPSGVYKDRADWDSVYWATHCVDCYPGNCPMRVYVKDGKVVREESAAVFPVVEEGVPDMNPMGCQKGVSWSRQLEADERILYPLKRVGERGSGKWERVTWDQAATEIADAVLDAVEEVGAESIVAPSGCNTSPQMGLARGKYLQAVGGIITDVNAEMNDFAPGYYTAYGDLGPVSSMDDWFHSDVFIIWFGNPTYTRIPHIHFVNEARYHGCEVVTIAPDFSPSAVHSDTYIPVKVGSDAALALAMSKVIIDEGLVDEQFVREQTDLTLLVNRETKKFLRASDLEENGHDEQFHAWDRKSNEVVEAPRGTLFWGDLDPALEGTFTVKTLEGSVEVSPTYQLLLERLEEFPPERAQEVCGVHPDTVRSLARKIAAGRTSILGALGGVGKYYHGDLIERAQVLLLALTGNWGKQGTGVRVWLSGLFDGAALFGMKSQPGQELAIQIMEAREKGFQAAMEKDPSLTPMVIAMEQAKAPQGAMMPSFFWWYNHAGHREAWNTSEWHDPSMKRTFDEYVEEAMEAGWWDGFNHPGPEETPRVVIECGGNVLRRTRGGSKRLLESVWPKLTMVVTVDIRMSTTALYSDFVLPAAQQYEKIGFHFGSSHTMNLTFSDKAVEPPAEAVSEWEGFRRLAEKLEERAIARGIEPYTDARGTLRDPTKAHSSYTKDGAFVDEELIADEMLKDSAVTGVLPENASLEQIRKDGIMRWRTMGIHPRSMSMATDPKPNETFAPYRRHVELGEPFPTLTRRVQLMIDHDWFIEVDEHLPTHKDAPMSGGDYPFQLTSGHNRWSVHSDNIANKTMLDTNRGTPHIVINNRDAERLGVSDNEMVRVYNDVGEFQVPARVTASAGPGQVVMYNGFEPYQFPNWAGPNDAEPGMVKWLHLVGDYGHLRYSATMWQPCAVMRGTRVGVERAG